MKKSRSSKSKSIGFSPNFDSKVLVILLIVFVVAGSITLGTSLAARPSRSGGSATLSASPNPVATNTTFVLSGCGYTVGDKIYLQFNQTGQTGFLFWATNADSRGCFSYNRISNSAPVTYTINAYQTSHNKTVLKASTTEVVQ